MAKNFLRAVKSVMTHSRLTNLAGSVFRGHVKALCGFVGTKNMAACGMCGYL